MLAIKFAVAAPSDGCPVIDGGGISPDAPVKVMGTQLVAAGPHDLGRVRG